MADKNQDIIMYAKKEFAPRMNDGTLTVAHFIKWYKKDKGVTLTKKDVIDAFKAYGQQRYIKESVNEVRKDREII